MFSLPVEVSGILPTVQLSSHCCSVTNLCLTLCNPVDCSPPGSSVCGISQAGILEWVAVSSSSWQGSLAHITAQAEAQRGGRWTEESWP